MKFQIEVPNLPIADLSSPSVELQKFLHELMVFCSFLTSGFKMANGWDIFIAYVRKGPDTVFVSSDNSVRKVYWLEKTKPSEEQEVRPERTIEELDADSDFDPHDVAMGPDRPGGDWIVMRYCCEGLPFTDLYASDFMNGNAEKSFAKVLKAILKRCGKTPNISKRLKSAIQELQKCDPQLRL